MTIKTHYDGLKKKKKKNNSFPSSTTLQNTDLAAIKFVPKTRGYVNFIPALEVFSFFSRETDLTSLINIRTKGDDLERVRSREISC